MLVHAMGNSPHMEQLMRLATKHRLVVIEDTCESLGSRHGGHLLGTQGHFGAYSFYYSHHITSGEGGAVVSSIHDNGTVCQTLRSLRAHGWTREFSDERKREIEAAHPDIDPRFLLVVGGNRRKSESDAPARRYATLREAAASGARGPLWLPVSALRDTPLARLTRLVAARVRSFVEPAADFTLLGAAVGALAPRPVAPARVALPVACAAARLTPDEVRARSSRAVSALQQEFRLALAHGGYDEADRAYLGTWLGKIEPPEFGEMPRGLLEQATVPTDPLIRHVPYPAYCRGVTSAALPPLPPPPGPLAVPVWATAWRHSLVPEAAALVCSWLRLLRDGLRRFAAGEPGERVARDMPPALAIGVTNFSPWAAEVARRGDVLVRRGGKFELLDLSQPPAAYRAGTGLNRAFLAELLAENGSEDFALRDISRESMARRRFCAWWRRLTFCRQTCFCGGTRDAARCASCRRKLLVQTLMIPRALSSRSWSGATAPFLGHCRVCCIHRWCTTARSR